MPFPTTRWSLLAHASLHGDSVQREALAEFYRRYRVPVVDFIQRRQGNRAQAEDLAQEFFVHLMEDSTLGRADRARGKFRSFLLGALLRFLARDHRRKQTDKRGGGESPVSLDAAAGGEGEAEPAVPAEVARAFDREWAQDLLVRAWAEVDAAWVARGAATELATLKSFLPGATETPTYEAAAARLGWTLARLKTEIFRLRGQFRDHVRAEIALTVETPAEIEAELAHLHTVLANPDA
ncbi:MAG: sigma-70 family RNA polymerase sigma factor [Opitutaceae bacterium]|nr:sigma-70 family RNA polymerase sigma factor [Opitutaceae bacterium]